MVESSGRVPLHSGEGWWTGVTDPLRQFTSKVADFFSPSAEAAGSEQYYEISIELPGVAEKDIDISVDHNTLSVVGEKKVERKEEGKTYFFTERSYGRFQRSFRLPSDADQDKIKATYKDGVLNLLVAKTQPGKDGARKVAINPG